MINKNRILLLVWVLILLASAVWVGKTLKVNSDLGQFMPQEDTIENQLMLAAVKSGPGTSVLMLGLSAKKSSQLTSLELSRANKKLARQFRKNKRVRQVINGELRFSKEHKKFLMQYHWLLNTRLDKETFSHANISQRMHYVLEQLRSPAPLIDKSLVPVDPLGSIIQVLRGWASKVRPSREHGVWFSRDKQQTLMFVHTRAGGFEINKQQALIKDINKAFTALGNDKIKLTISGPGYYAVEYRRIIREDIVRLSISAGIFISLMLILVYRAITPLMLALMPLATAALAGIIAVSTVYGHIHGITLAFGVTLVGVTIDYPIHLFTHLRNKGSALVTMRGIWPTLRLGVLTTGIGFTAMLLAGFEGLKQLAVFSICGLFAAALTTRYLLPRVVSPHYHYQSWSGLERLTDGIVRLTAKLPWAIAIVVVSALIWLLMQPQLTDHDPKKLTPLTSEHKKIDKKLRSIIGTSDTRFLMTVTGKSVQQILVTLEKLEPALNKLVDKKIIGSYILASRYLPSIKKQKYRQSLLPENDTLKTVFQHAVTGTIFNIDSFQVFFDNVKTAKNLPPLTYERVMKTPLSIQVGGLFHLRTQGRGWMVLVPLQKIKKREELLTWAEQQNIPGLRVMDVRSKATTAIQTYSNEAIQLIAWGSIIIVLVLWLGLRSIRDVLRVALPIVSSLILTIATWNLFGVKLNIFHLVSLLLVIGIGIDYALFFIRRTNEEDHHLDYMAVWVSNLTTVVVFGFLFFAYPLVLQAVGGTVAMGALYAYIISASVATKTQAI